MIVKVRISAHSREAIAAALALLADRLGDDRLDGFTLPERAGRHGDWLTYFQLDVSVSDPHDSDEADRGHKGKGIE